MGEKKGGFNWLMGCGIGCAVLIVIAVIAGICIYFVIQKGLETARVEMSKQMQKEYDKAVEGGKVPEEHRELLDSLMAITHREDAGFFGVLMAGGAAMDALADGEIDEEELTMLTAVKEFLELNPAPNPVAMGQFMEKHPELDFDMQQMQQQGGQGWSPKKPAPVPEEVEGEVAVP